jgi:Tol biopolymer transport system component
MKVAEIFFDRVQAMSGDGRYIAYTSSDSNIVTGDANLATDLFVYDRISGTTKRVNISSNGEEANSGMDKYDGVSMSYDGQYIAFVSGASNLVEGDNNGVADVFVHGSVSGTTLRVSVSTNGQEADQKCWSPSISSDGQYVVFWTSASNLVDGDTNGRRDVFLSDVKTGITRRLSIAKNGEEFFGDSYIPSISGDGRYVAFSSEEPILPSDTNNKMDVYLLDMLTGQYTHVSKNLNGGSGDKESYTRQHSVSNDGRYVAFYSTSTNLVEDDKNGAYDVFVHDRLNDRIRRLSVSSIGKESYGHSILRGISISGSHVVYFSGGRLVEGDTNNQDDIYLTNIPSIDE